ncbi:MAG TPA: topoisomerase C-terminal repeat-containing protein, partial [Stellaceae bacterium]|nr:topoisomerase C-terminal repeat-containing protein [Stellaceae bacterium]
RGRLVTAFLASFFERYVQYSFTADLENQLDEISGGRIDWKEVLRQFWHDFSAAVEGTRELTISQVLATLDAELGAHFFPAEANGRDPRLCPGCGAGRLGLKLGKFGAFIGCSNYPNCRYTRPLALEGEESPADRALGDDPASGLPVMLKKGPYGHYVQLGDTEGERKPKRVAVPRGMSPAEIDLDRALRLLSLPRELGRHPDTGQPIVAGIGRFGAYLKHGDTFRSLGADDDVLTIGLNRAVTVLAEESTRRRPAAQPLKNLGEHPEGGAVTIYRGRYGPYVAHDGVIASLPRAVEPDALTLDAAIALLREKGKGRAAKSAPHGGAPRKAAAASARAKPDTGNGSAGKTTKRTAKKRTSRPADGHPARSATSTRRSRVGTAKRDTP